MTISRRPVDDLAQLQLSHAPHGLVQHLAAVGQVDQRGIELRLEVMAMQARHRPPG